jgi:outer membrane protein assembly factor BamE (lipoprotein component of BamABCDE complex)
MRHLILLLAILSASCSSTLPSFKTYKLDVQQGNVVTSKMMMQLKPGMTKSQVRYLLGSPLLQDSFHPDRWDYLYEMNKDGKVIERRRVVMEFGEQGLKTVRGDIIPGGQPGAENAPVASVEDVITATSNKTLLNEDPKKGWLGRFKFWADDDSAVQSKSGSPKVYQGPMDKVVDASPKPVVEEPVVEKSAELPAVVEEAKVVAENAIIIEPVANQPDQPQALQEAPRDAVVVTKTPDQVLIEKRVASWANAWRNRNVNEYLGYYSNQFKPEGISKKAWLAQRKQRLSKQDEIKLSIENVEVRTDGKQAVAEFVQHYSASGYSDHVVKVLSFEQTQNEWMIVRELVKGKADSQQSTITQTSPTAEVVEAGKPRELTMDEKTDGPPVRKQVDEPKEEVVVPPAKADPAPAALPVPEVKKAIEKPVEKTVPQPVVKPAEKLQPNKNKPLPEEGEPGYFERMLEKIGF